MAKTPILFLIYNRPNKTASVFERIKKYQPDKLYIAADGPKNASDNRRCLESLEYTKAINWDCEVNYLVRKTNLGLRVAVTEAIDWFFSHEEFGIILEDDCVPNEQFFEFISYYLLKYKDDERIYTVSGNNPLPLPAHHPYSCKFTLNPYIWGWGTWRRAWNENIPTIEYWRKLKTTKDLLKQYNIRNTKVIRHWDVVLWLCSNNYINTWDYIWTFSIWMNKGYNLVPKTNLVTNIGFDSESTNTSSQNSDIFNDYGIMDDITQSPKEVDIDLDYEILLSKHAHNISSVSFIKTYLYYRFLK